MKCPSCGAEKQGGKYCAQCGAALDVTCPGCAASVPAGASYCTACGAAVTGGSGGARGFGGGSKAPWVIAAAALMAVVLFLFLPREADRVPAPGAGGGGTPLFDPSDPGGSGGMGGLSPDMRTNADRLFNRIMAAAEQGNRAEVEQFMPMAIQAYRAAEPLDDDGLYHLAILHTTAGDHDAARATAGQILDGNPDHILALGVAATAAQAGDDEAEARGLWDRLLAAYPRESGRPLPEYLDHQQMLSEYQTAAREATGGT